MIKFLPKVLPESPALGLVELDQTSPGNYQAKSLEGEVAGRHTMIICNRIDTGSDVEESVRLISQAGAQSIRLVSTHGAFAPETLDRLEKLPIKKIYVTNSLLQERHALIKTIDITPLLISR